MKKGALRKYRDLVNRILGRGLFGRVNDPAFSKQSLTKETMRDLFRQADPEGRKYKSWYYIDKFAKKFLGEDLPELRELRKVKQEGESQADFDKRQNKFTRKIKAIDRAKKREEKKGRGEDLEIKKNRTKAEKKALEDKFSIMYYNGNTNNPINGVLEVAYRGNVLKQYDNLGFKMFIQVSQYGLVKSSNLFGAGRSSEIESYLMGFNLDSDSSLTAYINYGKGSIRYFVSIQ